MLPLNFSVKNYLELNDDIGHLTDEQAIQHFLNHGIKENRKYKFDILPFDFNYNTYLRLNPDLGAMSYNQAKNHYLKYGKGENRKYKYDLPSDFDHKMYVKINQDLKKNGKDFDKNEAIFHYINYGRNEGRKYKIHLPFDINMEEKKYVEFSSDYINEDNKNNNKSNFILYENLHKINIKLFTKIIYIIGNNFEGGTFKYTKDLIKNFKSVLFVFLTYSNSLHEINFKEDDILFCNQLSNTTIKIDDLITIKKKCNCKIFLVAHDMYWIYYDLSENKIHGGYLNNDNDIKNNENLIYVFDNFFVIFPTNFVKNCYMNFFDIKNYIVTPHIDEEIIDRNINPNIIDNNINIGVFVRYSVYKGREFVEKLFSKFNEYNGYKINFKIVGHNIPLYDEHKFNEHVKKHHIHGFLLLNKYGETWSYALTKHLNSGLPILYNNIGSYIERIPNDEKYMKCYENELQYGDENILEIKFTNFLNYIISKQNNIDQYINKHNNIIVPNFYNDLFLDNIKDKNIVMITSKIIVSNEKYTYVNTRSIYSKEERFQQTLMTISSVRQYIPNSYIILCDNSIFDDEMNNELLKQTDLFLNVTDDRLFNYETDVSIFKGIGELYQLLVVKKYFFDKINSSILGRNIFKISGRYTINEQFDYSKFNIDGNVFKRNTDEEVKDIKYFFTSLYKIDRSFITEYLSILQRGYKHKSDVEGRNMEEFIPEWINFNFTQIETLGLTQRIAVWNIINNI